MNLPRLTADASLYSSTVRYHGYCAPKPAVAAVTPSQRPAPGDTYQYSCPNCQLLVGEDLFLICDCYDESGNLHRGTAIAPDYCGPIANCNGTLCC
jgi:hypothetical protein